MSLNPNMLEVPIRLKTADFVVHRQRISDNELDFDAVVSSKQILREWSDSEWPEDDFTLEQNAQDIAEHIADHEQNSDYGFSIFTPNEDRLLGSLYLNAVGPLLEHYPTDPMTLARLLEFDVRVEYWLRSGVGLNLELRFIRAVIGWLEEKWWFERPVFGSRKDMFTRRELYAELGMTEVAALISVNGLRRFHFHAQKP
jgi:RimJ/RimL family protein N-acetyltransferase